MFQPKRSKILALCSLLMLTVPPTFAGGAISSSGDLRLVHAIPVNAYNNLTEAERFEKEKDKRMDVASAVYAASLKPVLNKTWTAPPHRGLLATRIHVLLDASGKLSAQRLIASSHNHIEDASATSFVESFAFPALPQILHSLELELCFMSDGTMNMVEAKTLRKASFPTRHSNNLDVRYLASFEQRVKKHWTPPDGYETRTVLADCRIDKNGTLSNLRLDHLSGMTGDDQSALKALSDAQPFAAFPANGPDEVDMRVMFSAVHHEQFVPHSLINHSQTSIQPPHAQVASDLAMYLGDVNRRVKRAWFPPKMSENRRVVVAFKIHANGQLSNLAISHSSGLAIVDQAALRGIENATPFGSLPNQSYENIDVQYTFDLREGFAGTVLGSTRK